MPSADLDLLPPPRRPHPDLARPRLPGPTPDQPVVLAVALPGSGRSTWLHQVVDRFGGPLIATTVAAAPGVAVHLTATGPRLPARREDRLGIAERGRTVPPPV